MDEQRRVPDAEEAHGRRRHRVREDAVGHVEELLALGAEEPAEPRAGERRAHLADPQPAEARDVLARRGAEGAQVRPDEVVERAGGRDGGRAQLGLGERVEVRARLLPRARGRHAQHVDPQAHALDALTPDERLDLATVDGPVGEAAAQRARGPRELGGGEPPAAGGEEPAPARVAHGERDRPEVAGRDEVDRGPLERALHDVRASSARVSASRSRSRTRDHSPTYAAGAYCACRPQICASAAAGSTAARSSRSWRARSARCSSRAVRVRSGSSTAVAGARA